MFRKQAQVQRIANEEEEACRELCALASSGALTDREWKQLSGHLEDCKECREELAQYQEICTFGMSLLSPNDASLDLESEWSPESAVAKLMHRLQDQAEDTADLQIKSRSARHLSWISLRSFNTALPYAAAFILFAVVCTSLYFAGVRVGVQRTNSYPQLLAQPQSSLQGLVQERSRLQAELQSGAAQLEMVSHQLQEARAAKGSVDAEKKASDDKLGQLEQRLRAEQSGSAVAHAQLQDLQNTRTVIAEKLSASEATLAVLQRDFDLMRDQHAADLSEIGKLEGQIANSSHRPQPASFVEAQQLPASDPELSELMGARDLLIADVYDIDKSGLPQKPFGRIFYTRGRRLLFYAFDLDRQPGVKNTSNFQVWGRRGYGDTHPLNMGLMYLDNKISKRWALKFDDAKALAEIDAVFVTIEPHSNNTVPKGRQLLYASLNTPANHP